jgi:hypothetical protein
MRKRSKYRPKPLPVLAKIFRHNKEAEVDLQFIPHMELQKFKTGDADEYTWNTVCFRLNWGYVMSGDHFDSVEARELMEQSLAAIKSVKARHERTNKWGTTGEEFNVIGQALNLTDEMQLNTTRRQQEDSLNTLFRLNELKIGGKF